MCKFKKTFFQIIRFGAVGAIAFIIDYSILFILTEIIGIYYLLSAAVSFIISTIFNYIFSMLWVFNGKQNVSKRKEFLLFSILSIIGLVINQITMLLFVEIIHIYYMWSKIIATFIVMIWNFITRKLFLEEHI